MIDPRKDRIADLRRRELVRTAALYRLASYVAPARPNVRARARRVVVWMSRRLIALGVRLFVLSKSWEQRANPVYNDVSECEPFAVESAAE